MLSRLNINLLKVIATSICGVVMFISFLFLLCRAADEEAYINKVYIENYYNTVEQSIQYDKGL